MDPAGNKQRVINAVEAFNSGDLDAYLSSYAANAVIHGLPPHLEPNLTGHREYLTSVRAGLPDFRATIDDIIAEADLVAVRMTYHGTHLGPLMDVAATGRQVRWQAMTFRRCGADGLTVERWIQGDTLGLLTQLGLTLRPVPVRTP
jgi:predicted ester cyclase